jgi:hypothetical protein
MLERFKTVSRNHLPLFNAVAPRQNIGAFDREKIIETESS